MDEPQLPATSSKSPLNAYADKFLAYLLTKHLDHNSLLLILMGYKNANDGNVGNSRRTTSDFLYDLMEGINAIVGANSQDTARLDLSGTEETRVALTYFLLIAIRHILVSQATVVKHAKLDQSQFAPMLFRALQPIFKKVSEELAKVSSASFQKGHALHFVGRKKRAIEKQGHLLELAKPIEESYLPYFKTVHQSIQQAMLENNSVDPVQPLFDYCAMKEDDYISAQRPKKRKYIYDALKNYFMARTADDFVDVFAQIQAGIKYSRLEGENKQKSRGAESVLVGLRDWLFYYLFLNPETKNYIQFTTEQRQSILEHLSYTAVVTRITNDMQVRDSDVSPYVIELVHDNVDALIPQLRRMLEYPDYINGEQISLKSKAEFCKSLGVRWATTMTAWLKNPNITDQQRADIAVCGYVWNRYMAELGVSEPNWYVPQIYVGFDVIAKHPWLPTLLSLTPVIKELDLLCTTNFAKTQSILAPRCVELLKGPEKDIRNSGEDSTLGMLERHIANKKYGEAIELIKKELDIDLKMDKKVDRADICVKLGLRMAQALTDLLTDSVLSQEQRNEVAFCAAIWNARMLEKKVKDARSYVPQHCVNLSTVRDSKSLTGKNVGLIGGDKGHKELKKDLDKTCKESRHVVTAQGMLASVAFETAVVQTDAAAFLPTTVDLEDDDSFDLDKAAKLGRESLAKKEADSSLTGSSSFSTFAVSARRASQEAVAPAAVDKAATRTSPSPSNSSGESDSK